MATILIIEDRRENIVFIANNILKPRGFEVITARNGKLGLEKAEAEMPDLIITDIKLPKMSGLEVMAQLLKKGIFIPTIVMTFHGTEETAAEALRLGARDYLRKPFTPEDMDAALERALKPQATTPAAYRQKIGMQQQLTSLESDIEALRLKLAEKETSLQDMHKASINYVDKTDMAEAAERAEAWEEDNARLSELLAETKDALSKAETRADLLKEAVVAQRIQTSKYQKEAKRLARELRNLSEAMRLMSQDMEHYMNRLVILTPDQEG